MAAKMSTARLASNPEVPVLAEDYQREKDGEVLCDPCRCRVEGVSGSSPTRNGNVITIPAYFRLPKHAEKTGEGHRSWCRHNLDRQVDVIVANSIKISTVDKSAEPMLTAVRGKLVEFRLHIVMELLRWSRSNEDAIGTGDSGWVAPVTGVRYVRSSKLLNAYFTDANAILSLIAEVEEMSDLASRIALRYGTDVMSWDEYFFSLTDYAKLCLYLKKLGQYSGTNHSNRPVAIAIQPRQWEIKKTQYGDWQLWGRSQPEVFPDGNTYAVTPVLYFRDEQLARSTREEQAILVCAIPKVEEFLKEQKKESLHPEIAVKMKVLHEKQICRYSPTDS